MSVYVSRGFFCLKTDILITSKFLGLIKPIPRFCVQALYDSVSFPNYPKRTRGGIGGGSLEMGGRRKYIFAWKKYVFCRKKYIFS